MKVFAKRILNPTQIQAVIPLMVDGVEVILNKRDLANPDFNDKLKFCSDNFETVNLETGDRLYGIKPTDIIDQESQKYVESVLESLQRIPNPGLLVIHLAAGCQVLNPPYSGLVPEKKEDTLEKALDYIRSLDPENNTIALENTFPTDWMNEEQGIISFYPIGKISADFKERIRTFDIAHSGVSMFTYANLQPRNSRYGTLETHFGKTPVYFSDEENRIADIAKRSITDAVLSELRNANVVNVHFNASRGLLDGFGVEGVNADRKVEGFKASNKNDFDLVHILETIGKENSHVNLVPEIKETDYTSIPEQKKAISYIKDFKARFS